MATAWLAVLFLAATPAPTNEEAIVRALKEYHAAFEAGDPARVLEVLGPTYFIGDERSAGGQDRLKAHFFKVGDTLRDWPKNFLASSAPYRNSTMVASVTPRSSWRGRPGATSSGAGRTRRPPGCSAEPAAAGASSGRSSSTSSFRNRLSAGKRRR